VPGADFVLLRDVGHFMWLEKPGCVAEALDALVRPS
jgi:pimeloyl-ACP methyl ester carboxylesterase